MSIDPNDPEYQPFLELTTSWVRSVDDFARYFKPECAKPGNSDDSCFDYHKCTDHSDATCYYQSDFQQLVYYLVENQNNLPNHVFYSYRHGNDDHDLFLKTRRVCNFSGPEAEFSCDLISYKEGLSNKSCIIYNILNIDSIKEQKERLSCKSFENNEIAIIIAFEDNFIISMRCTDYFIDNIGCT